MLTRRNILTAAPVLLIPSAAQAVPLEPVCDRLERLCNELQDCLGEWCNGQFMAKVYPSNHPRESFYFSPVRKSPEVRLHAAAADFKNAAREIDPTVTEWWQGQALDDSLTCRFSLYGCRK